MSPQSDISSLVSDITAVISPGKSPDLNGFPLSIKSFNLVNGAKLQGED